MVEEQQAVPVAQEDREAAAKFAQAVVELDNPTEFGALAAQAFARHRLASLPCKSGEGAGVCSSCDGTGVDLYDGNSGRDCTVCNGRKIIAPDATQTREAEFIRAVKDDLRGPDGEEYTDSGMEDAFFRWPVVERALRAALNARGGA